MLIGLLIAAAVVFIYWPARYGEFVFDDLVFGNYKELVRGNWRAILKSGSWRACLNATYALNVLATGWYVDKHNNPLPRTLIGFHAVNVSLHIVNSLILWAVFHVAQVPSPWIAALIFAVHPLCSQGVAYVSGRPNVLSATFVFSAIYVMMLGWAVPACVLIGVACLFKQDSVALFALIAAVGWMYSVPFWWIALIVPVLALFWFRTSLNALIHNTGEDELTSAGFSGILPSPTYQITAFTESVRRLPYWFLGCGFSADHRIKVRSWTSPMFWASLIFVATELLLLSGHPLYILALLLVFIPMTPYWLVPMPDPVMEQRLYIPAAGLALALGAAGLPSFVLAAGIIWYMGRTWSRSWYWRSVVSLWSSVIHGGGRTDRALANLGMRHIEQGDSYNAHRCLEDALTLNPQLAIARSNLAILDKLEGKLTEAIAGFEETVRRNPRFYQGWYALGCALQQAGRMRESVEAHTKCVQLRKWAPSINRLGMHAVMAGHIAEGQHYFEQAVAENPTGIDYAHNLGWSLQLQGRNAEAMAVFKQLPRKYRITSEMMVVQKEA